VQTENKINANLAGGYCIEEEKQAGTSSTTIGFQKNLAEVLADDLRLFSNPGQIESLPTQTLDSKDRGNS
jgi:hypothetical protein